MNGPLVSAAMTGVGFISTDDKARRPLQKKSKNRSPPSSLSSPSSLPPLNPTELIALENEYWEAQKRCGSAMLPYLSTDCVMMLPMGLQVSHDSMPSIRDILESPAFVPWETCMLNGVTVTAVGAGGAVVSYRVRAERGPREEEEVFRALCTSVWRWEEGRESEGLSGGKAEEAKWFMCAHQQTPFEHGVEEY